MAYGCMHLLLLVLALLAMLPVGNAHTGAARPYTRDGRQARNARVPDLLIARRKEGWKKTELSASSKLPAMQKVAETGRSVEVERLGASFALSGNPMAAEKSVPTMACRVHASAAGRLVCVVSCMLASVVGRATKASPEIPRAGRDGGGDSVDVGGSATINKGADSVGAQYSYAMVAPNEFNMYPASKIEAIPAGSEKGAFKAAPHEFDHSMQHTNVQQDSQAATKQQSKAANTQSSKESNTKESKAAGSAVAAPHGAEHIPLR